MSFGGIRMDGKEGFADTTWGDILGGNNTCAIVLSSCKAAK
jgi:hypothetical protein